MNDNALYFPHINVPNSSWFTRSLLYFDQVGCIMPYTLVKNMAGIEPFTRELMQAELIEAVIPEYDLDCSRLAEMFASHLDHLPIAELQNRRVSLLCDDLGTFIHSDKIGNLGHGLASAGLALYPRSEWPFVERKTADEYMAALSAFICGGESQWNRPITDEPSHLSPFFSSGDLGYFRLDKTRTRLLKKAFPAPRFPITAVELRRFKSKYGDELAKFRRYLESELVALASIQDQVVHDYKLQLLENYLADETERICSYMKSRRWHVIPLDLCSVILDDASVPGANIVSWVIKKALGKNPADACPIAYAGFAQYELVLDDVHF